MKEFRRDSAFVRLFSQYFHNATTFKEIIDSNRYLSISGSTILMLLSNQRYDNADIDIYIDVSGDLPSIMKTLDVLYSFITDANNGYTIQNRNMDHSLISIMELLQNPYERFMYNPYWSLREYIFKVTNYTSRRFSSKIQFIFIRSPIHKMITESFDFDIIKNYYCLGTIFCYFPRSIQLRKATMTKAHFMNRICSSEYELNRFYERYNKYSRRGYSIYINDLLISRTLFHYLYNQEFSYSKSALIYKITLIHVVKQFVRKMKQRKLNILKEKENSSVVLYDPVMTGLTTKLDTCYVSSYPMYPKKRKMVMADEHRLNEYI